MASKPLTGSTEPRIWTPPLRRLNRQTSAGYEIVEKAEAMGQPLLPWQAWLAKHAGETLPDGRPRFRVVLVIVARQAGKTTLLQVLTKYWLFYLPAPALILGTSTKLETAKRSWAKVERWSRQFGAPGKTNPYIEAINRGGGTSHLIRTYAGNEYMVTAANSAGGRGESIDRAVVDELREHHTFEAWDAIEPATIARPYAQVWAITNQGDDESIVLHELRDQALKAIQERNEESRIGLFEWSAPDGCDPQDPEAWRQAQPALGYTIPVDDYRDRAARAVMAGGSVLAGFRTEYLSQRVKLLDPAVDPDRWEACRSYGSLAGMRDRIALCLDVAPNGQHASLIAGAEEETIFGPAVRVELVKSWEGMHAVDECRRELPELVGRIKPRVLGWFPNGPAAVMAADMKERRPYGWPPAGVKIEEVKSDLAAVCMGFAEQVTAGRVLHSGQEILDTHVMGAQKLYRGDLWVFSRRGGTCDAAYAAAGVTHLVRGLPAAVPMEGFRILSV